MSTRPLPRRYFDKTGTGYLRVEDLRRILHNLDQGLPHRAIKALVAAVADPHGAYRGERVYYRYVLRVVLCPKFQRGVAGLTVSVYIASLQGPD